MENSDVISTLNNVIETLKDGQEGFRLAAGKVQSGDLRALFNAYSMQRSKFAGELQSLLHSLGESEPEDSGSTAGALHRGWINLKDVLSRDDDHAILAECERGEDSAKESYEKVLKLEGLPVNVQETLSDQFAEVQAAHDKVRDLRDEAAD